MRPFSVSIPRFEPSRRLAELRQHPPTTAIGCGLAAVAVVSGLPAAIGGDSLLWITLAIGTGVGTAVSSKLPSHRYAAAASLLVAAAALVASGWVNSGLLSLFGASTASDLLRAAVIGTACIAPVVALAVRIGPLATAATIAAACLAIPVASPLVLLTLAVISAAIRPTPGAALEAGPASPHDLTRSIAGGLLVAAALRLSLLWMPPSILTPLALTLAAVVSLRLRVTPVAIAAAAAALLMLEPIAVRSALWSTATISSPLLLSTLRILAAVGLLLVPMAAATRSRHPLAITAAVLTFVFATLSAPSVVVLLAVGGAVALIEPFACLVRRATPRPLPAAAAALLAAASVFGGVSTSQPAVLLYSGDAFAAVRRGESTADILASVAVRPTGHDTLPGGELTRWSVDGLRTVVRDNGLPTGSMTIDPTLAPSDAVAAVSVAVPLCVHPQADRVAIVGLGSGESMLTALPFPVRSLQIVERPGRRELLESGYGSRSDRLGDDRLTFVDAAPSELAAVDRLDADVILLTTSQPAFLTSAGLFHDRYYRTVRSHLADGGLVAQRLRTPDLTPGALARLLATLDEVFADVAMVQTGPSETLLLAGDLAGRLDCDGIARRLRTPHAREVLADAGLDWASVIELRLIDADLTRELAALADPFISIAAAAERSLVFDLMDWSPKWTGHRKTWAEYGTPMIEMLDDIILRKEAISRVEDVRQRDQIVLTDPDQYWAYRKTLKERLQKRPRSAVQQVNGELDHGLYPEDRRRKEYLRTLGEATTERDDAAVERLDDFARPHDPLVSYFLHGEAARLHRKADRPGRALSHLTSQIFAAPADPSVRPILDAVELLIDQPDLIDDPVTRYDFAHGLLDQLHRRWLLRSARDIHSQLEGIDLDDSTRLTREMLAQLDAWADEAGTGDHWDRRRGRLRRELLDGLRRLQNQKIQRAASVARLQAQLKARETAEATAGRTDDPLSLFDDAAGDAAESR